MRGQGDGKRERLKNTEGLKKGRKRVRETSWEGKIERRATLWNKCKKSPHHFIH